MIETSHIPKIGDAKIKNSITDVLEENKKLKLIVLTRQKEISALKAEQTHENAKLLSPEEIQAKLGPNILHEVGYFHARSKISGPQGAMLSSGNLLTVLKNATITTGEFEYYKKTFSVCETEVDSAMAFYMSGNFVAEMQSCRRVQFLLGMLVGRGYGTYDSNTYEQLVLEQEPQGGG